MATSQASTVGAGARSLLTVEEFYEHFKPKIGKNRIRDLINRHVIRSIRLGERKILIPATELTEWPEREVDRVT